MEGSIDKLQDLKGANNGLGNPSSFIVIDSTYLFHLYRF